MKVIVASSVSSHAGTPRWSLLVEMDIAASAPQPMVIQNAQSRVNGLS
jgi:hypothetical protein